MASLGKTREQREGEKTIPPPKKTSPEKPPAQSTSKIKTVVTIHQPSKDNVNIELPSYESLAEDMDTNEQSGDAKGNGDALPPDSTPDKTPPKLSKDSDPAMEH